MKNNIILKELKQLKESAHSKTDKKKFDGVIRTTKVYMDKLYNMAYIDDEVNVGNMNKLKDDISFLKEEKGQNIYILTIKVKGFGQSLLLDKNKRLQKNKEVRDVLERIKELFQETTSKEEKIEFYRVDGTINMIFTGHKKGTKMIDKIDVNKDLFPDFGTIGYNKLDNEYAKIKKNIVSTISKNIKKGGY